MTALGTAWAGRVGVIGIGAMGLPMAGHLQRQGLAPWVRDIDPHAVEAARAQGLAVCASAAELARPCEVVFVVVVDAAQIAEVLFGEGGLVHAGRAADAPRQTVVLCSTIAPADTEAFQQGLARQGIATIDAPISGGPARAAEGRLAMMVAGDPAVVEPCEPLLRTLASALYRVGERVGDGARVKLVNNLLAGINLVAGAEALALGAQLGLDRRLLFEVIQASSGNSWIFSDRMARALDGDYAPRARAAILTKDVGLAVQMAGDAGIATPLGEQALAVYRATVAAGLGDADDAAVIRTLFPGF